MKQLFQVVFIFSILILHSCQKTKTEVPKPPSVLPQISYEELSFTSFEEALLLANDYSIRARKKRQGASLRDDFPNQTIDNAGWLIEAMANLDFRYVDSDLSDLQLIEDTITVQKTNDEVNGEDLILKYNELYNTINSELNETKRAKFIDIELDTENSTSSVAQFYLKGVIGNVIQYFDHCVVKDDDYWRLGNNEGTCRPNPADDEFYGEKDASERETEIINSTYCFGSDMCIGGTGSNLYWLSVTAASFWYNASNLGELWWNEQINDEVV